MVSMSLRLQCMVLECQSCHGSASLRRPFLQVFLWEELRQSTSDHGPAQSNGMCLLEFVVH
jgi:hypothetical protein